MFYIKSRLSAWRAHRLARQNQSPRYTVDYGQAERIGILLQGKPPFFVEEALRLRDLLEQDGKQVSVLAFFQRPSPEDEQLSGVSTFCNKDISWTGKITSPDVEVFVHEPFDYLYCFAPAHSLIFDSILAASKAKCRMGCHEKTKEHLYEVMIHLEGKNSGEVLVQEMLRYSRTLAYV